MTFYELTFITRADLSVQDIDGIVNEIHVILKDNGGSIAKKEYWGLRALAYKINKAAKGHYQFLGIEANGAAVKEIERVLNLKEDVVRQMCIRVDAIDPKPSALINTEDDTQDEHAA